MLAPRQLTRAVLSGIVVLTVLGVVVHVLRLGFGRDTIYGLGALFDTTREANVPTWASSALLLACAGVLGSIALRVRAGGGRDARPWLALALLFCLASLDETANLHELVGRFVRRTVEGAEGVARPWVLVLGPVALVVVLAFARFVARQPGPTRRAFAVGALLLLGGGLGLELVEIAIDPRGRQEADLVALLMTQELLEMLGAAAFLHGAVAHHATLAGYPT